VRRSNVHHFAIAVLAGTLTAAAVHATDDPEGEIIDTACSTTGYKVESLKYDPVVAIPDGDAGGVRLGPLNFPDDGMAIAQVVFELYASHTRVGDLTAVLEYDLGCNGSVDASSTILCRVGRASCTSGTGTGCTTDLNCSRSYKFDDTATAFLGLNASGACRTANPIAKGCYKPTGQGATPLSAFKDMRKGGCFYLRITDPVTPDKGSVCEWSVFVLNHQAVGVEARSWSGTKILYR